MPYPNGTRVLALKNVEGNVVFSFGAGTYEGDQPCPRLGGLRNPKIELDSGQVAWGCEVWWGPEAELLEKYPAPRFSWVQVDIDWYREAAARPRCNPHD